MMNNSTEDYRKYLYSKKLSTNTVSSYIYDVSAFEEYLKTNYSLDITNARKAHILTYLVNQQKLGKSSSTVSRTVVALKNFFDFLKKERVVEENPALSIHSPKQIKRSPSVLTEEEVTMLMELPDTGTFKGSRDSAILELLYSSGIRVTELISISLQDLSLNAGILNIQGEDGRARIVPLSETTKKAIINYTDNFRNLKCKAENDYLFVNSKGERISRQGIWKMLKYYENKMTVINELSPQILRNSFAVHMLSNGADLGTVQELMGLSSLSAVQSYMQNLNFKSLEVFKKAFPRA